MTAELETAAAERLDAIEQLRAAADERLELIEKLSSGPLVRARERLGAGKRSDRQRGSGPPRFETLDDIEQEGSGGRAV